jgi:hypothetical protein
MGKKPSRPRVRRYAKPKPDKNKVAEGRAFEKLKKRVQFLKDLQPMSDAEARLMATGKVDEAIKEYADAYGDYISGILENPKKGKGDK